MKYVKFKATIQYRWTKRLLLAYADRSLGHVYAKNSRVLDQEEFMRATTTLENQEKSKEDGRASSLDI